MALNWRNGLSGGWSCSLRTANLENCLLIELAGLSWHSILEMSSEWVVSPPARLQVRWQVRSHKSDHQSSSRMNEDFENKQIVMLTETSCTRNCTQSILWGGQSHMQVFDQRRTFPVPQTDWQRRVWWSHALMNGAELVANLAFWEKARENFSGCVRHSHRWPECL